MALRSTNTNFGDVTYAQYLINSVKQWESNPYKTGMEYVGGNPTVGYGFDLRTAGAFDVNINNLNNEISDPARRLSALAIEYIRNYINNTAMELPIRYEGLPPAVDLGMEFRLPTIEDINTVIGNFKLLESEASSLLDKSLAKAESDLNKIAPGIPQSVERSVLVELVYQLGKDGFPNIVDAITDNTNPAQHALIWAEIRYDTNKERKSNLGAGVQNRRFDQSNRWGLYSSSNLQNVGEIELAAVASLLFHAKNGNDIRSGGILGSGYSVAKKTVTYDSDFLSFVNSALDNLKSRLGIANRDFDWAEYVKGSDVSTLATITGKVDSNDLVYGDDKDNNIFAGAGNDYVYGNDGADHLYGGAGTDHIYGGIGDDFLYAGEDTASLHDGANIVNHLYGGVGNDTYYYNNGDGTVVIYDSDAIGSIVINGTPIGTLQQLSQDNPNVFYCSVRKNSGSGLEI